MQKRYGIAITVDDSPTGAFISWRETKSGKVFDTYAEALEANDLDGWVGYVRDFPSGNICEESNLFQLPRV